MLTIAIGLTMAAIAIELMILYRWTRILESLRHNSAAGVMFSILVSWTLGTLFGAAGMIILFAATVSTVVTVVIYKSGLILAVKRIVAGIKRLAAVIP